jgi:hypothetical protein
MDIIVITKINQIICEHKENNGILTKGLFLMING